VEAFLKEEDAKLSQRFNTVLSQPSIYETLPQGVSKATALQSLAERLDLLPSEIMAIGDGNNDREMLEFAGLSIAMDNASAPIKALANHVTTSNNEDGVAAAIYQWILEK
jgi:Cof subfamily protein (haloacid dehalogenase superfamily)